MPKEFDACVKAGGKVRTKVLAGGKYQHVCYLKGKSYAGYIKKAKTEGKVGAAIARAAERKKHG
jgi:hypothetical protein